MLEHPVSPWQDISVGEELSTAPSFEELATPPALDHMQAPYFDALRRYAARNPGRYHVPGHKGGVGTDPHFLEVAADALELDIPLIINGIDVGPGPTPLERALAMAADAWGAKRTWFLSNGATQGNHGACLALATMGKEVIVQRNVHASTIDGLVLSGLQPTFVAPELNAELGIAHCLSPEALDLTLADSPGAVAAIVVSPTYYGAVADIRGLVKAAHGWGVPLLVDEAWGPHFPFHEALPEHALSAGADLVLSGTHKLVGSLTQSAMLHLSHDSLLDETVLERALTIVRSTSPSSLLLASLDAARRHAMVNGHHLLDDAIREVGAARSAIQALPGLDVLDDRLVHQDGVYDYDPLRLAIDVRATGVTGYELSALLHERSDINLELSGENMLVAVFGMGEPIRDSADRLIDALSDAVAHVSATPRQSRRRVPPPPRWGALATTPREAFLGAQEQVPVEAAVDRVAAESLAAYPPGIPNVLPGERLTAATLDYVIRHVGCGGTVRGAGDPTMRTIRVVVEH